MHLLAIISQKELLRAIRDYYGPSIDVVTILTISVQMLRDHEPEIHELWSFGRIATEWIGDKYEEEILAEIDAAERARDRSPSPACWLSGDWTGGARSRRWGWETHQDSSPLFWRAERPDRDWDRDYSVYSGDS